MKFPGSSEPRAGREPSPESGGVEIAELHPDQWQELRDIRAEAVVQSPRAFGTTVEQIRGMSEQEWKQLFTTGRYFIAREKGKLVGIVCMVRERESSASHIVNVYSLYVTPDARLRGVASALLKRVVEEATDGQTRKIRLTVDSESDAAKHLYEGMGFTEVGFLKDETRMGGTDEFVSKSVMEKFLG